MRAYCWALIGLGSVRFAYIVDMKSKPLWTLNVVMHIVESGFWWGEAVEPGADKFVPKSEQGIPIDPLQGIVLYGPPFLALLLIVTATPWRGGGGGRSRSRAPSSPGRTHSMSTRRGKES